MYFVYIHTLPNGKIYIGQTHDIIDRWGADGNGYADNDEFIEDIEKYGWDNIKHEILIKCDTKEKALEFEKLFIVLLDAENKKIGYNKTTIKKDLENLYANKEKLITRQKTKIENRNIFRKYKKSRSVALELINEWIFNEKYRYIVIRRWLDGVDYSELIKETGIGERQLKRIVYKCEKIIEEHI